MAYSSSTGGAPWTANVAARQTTSQKMAIAFLAPTNGVGGPSVYPQRVNNMPQATPQSTNGYHHPANGYAHNMPQSYSRHVPQPSSPFAQPARAPRPSYSEEQKFYIMYARIIRDWSWPDIEDGFCEIFGQRSKGGLTSVYYRIRRSWGLEEVLKGGTENFEKDKRLINAKAGNFSEDFLRSIGYLR